MQHRITVQFSVEAPDVEEAEVTLLSVLEYIHDTAQDSDKIQWQITAVESADSIEDVLEEQYLDEEYSEE